MRGLLLAVFLVFVIGVVVAYPQSSKSKYHPSQLFPSDRSRPISPRRSDTPEVANVGPGYMYRTPRYISYNPPVVYGYQWEPVKRSFRDDEDSSEEDDYSEEDDVEDDFDFDTPSWDSLFPREQQGPHGQDQQSYYSEGGPSQSYYESPNGQVQESQDDYEIVANSPGGPLYSGNWEVPSGIAGRGRSSWPGSSPVASRYRHSWNPSSRYVPYVYMNKRPETRRWAKSPVYYVSRNSPWYHSSRRHRYYWAPPMRYYGPQSGSWEYH